ncbi:MAG: methylated-DNA--[protein]-cysteine S-methyltransferase [Gallionella sp.]
MFYQAKLSLPFAVLGVRCDDTHLYGIDLLAVSDEPQPASRLFAAQVCAQLLSYVHNPDIKFSIPLKLTATLHQKKVWKALSLIPVGQTRRYGELALLLNSCAQAVGQACGANPFPIIIPCHRVVRKVGLGGFMKHTGGAPLDMKRWLLAHEQR